MVGIHRTKDNNAGGGGGGGVAVNIVDWHTANNSNCEGLCGALFLDNAGERRTLNNYTEG